MMALRLSIAVLLCSLIAFSSAAKRGVYSRVARSDIIGDPDENDSPLFFTRVTRGGSDYSESAKRNEPDPYLYTRVSRSDPSASSMLAMFCNRLELKDLSTYYNLFQDLSTAGLIQESDVSLEQVQKVTSILVGLRRALCPLEDMRIATKRSQEPQQSQPAASSSNGRGRFLLLRKYA